MDIVKLIQDAPLVDIGVFFILFAAVIFGVMQGAIRRLIGMASIFVAFLLAANLRQPFGDFLTDNWRQWPSGLDHMLAFAILFCTFTIAASIAAQGLYKRTDIYARKPVVDDVLGGVLGFAEAFLLMVIAIVIFSSYTIDQHYEGEIDLLRQAQDMLIHQSHIAGAIKDHIVPAFVGVLSPLLPTQIASLFN